MLKKAEPRADGRFISILADGLFHLKVPEGTEGEVKRKYETSDGKEGTANELVFSELSGKIDKVGFYDSNYGKLIQIIVVDGEEEPVIISVGTSGNFGTDLLKKLPNIDLKKEVTFAPYSFKDEKTGKPKRGVSITQGKEKIANFYFDEKKKENKHDFPEIDTAKLKAKKKAYWKGYFLAVEEFLVDDITKRFGIEDNQTEEARKF